MYAYVVCGTDHRYRTNTHTDGCNRDDWLTTLRYVDAKWAVSRQHFSRFSKQSR